MSLSVNFIEGRRGSACNNDAFSVVANGKELVDIIPLEDIPGKTGDDVLKAFNDAARRSADTAEIKQAARQTLGIYEPSFC